MELDGVGAPCPETYETQYGAVLAEIPAGDDLHLALPAGWTIAQFAVDAVPSSLIYDDPSPAGVRRGIWSGTPHASDVPVALDGVLVPGDWTLRVRITGRARVRRRRPVRRSDRSSEADEAGTPPGRPPLEALERPTRAVRRRAARFSTRLGLDILGHRGVYIAYRYIDGRRSRSRDGANDPRVRTVR